MAKKTHLISKNIVIFSIFTFLLIGSELVYAVSQRPPYFNNLISSFYFQKMQTSLQKPHLQTALKNLSKITKLHVAAQSKYYFQIPDYNPDIEFPTNNPALTNASLDHLRSLKSKSFAQSYPVNLAKTYYQLGLLCYQHDQPDLTVALWKTAIYVLPQWSDFHVELANYYISINDLASAQSQLDFCSTFEHAKEHCDIYNKENLIPKIPEKVGFRRKEIDQIPPSAN